MRRRGDEFSDTHLTKALRKTLPVLAHPEADDVVGDLGHIFSQPEMLDFWKAWTVARRASGPAPNIEFGKAMLATMAVPGLTSRGDDAHDLLENTPALRQTFEALSAAAGQSLQPRAYNSAMRLIHRAARPCHQLALQTNIDMLKALRAMGFDDIGKRLLIDGTAVPAWAQQISAGWLPKHPTPAQQAAHARREAKLREHAKEAGFRMIQHSSNGKITPKDKKVAGGLRSGKVKAWRGYYLVVIADQATGLPMVWSLTDASQDEARQIIPLLSDLFALWPELHDQRITEMIAGDSAWDEDEWCRLCEVDYGIAPIFRLHNDHGEKVVPAGFTRGTKVAAITHTGELLCRAHMKPAKMISFEPNKRDPSLYAGQTSRNEFRVRARCDHHGGGSGAGRPCGHLQIKAEFDWSKLTRYPHHNTGRPELHAMRQAMLIRLSQIESLFNVLKTGNLVAGSGPTRTRMTDHVTHGALIDLAFLGTTALTLADQIQRHCVSVPPLPAATTSAATAPAAASGPTGSLMPAAQAPTSPLPSGPPISPVPAPGPPIT